MHEQRAPVSRRAVMATESMVRRLRPRRIAAALRRRWFEWRMRKLPCSPAEGLAALGTEYGSYVLPVEEVRDGWVCYCVGTGADVSFELALTGLRRVEIRSFEAVGELADHVRAEVDGLPSISIEHAALAVADGPLQMQRSHVPVSRSVSAANLYSGDDYAEVPGRKLATLMAEHADSRIDLLKLDVEGLEYELLRAIDLGALGVKVLCAQLHHTARVREAKALIAELREQGYELVACHPTVKLTFVRRGVAQPPLKPPEPEDVAVERRELSSTG